ncbi:hypothetical protein [Halorubrum sp. ARQ200]|uniref:hypothetical protein n=1 Tax=Halorubrum sp. ARQ200 TaxID=1855872 RepID=UPI0010F70784|nr:hypothetical protein [Halorubrum sp. ARQ200]TKX43856.1 hypothetical protein EXE50_08655 [Halorubrum sp. ARQ200]
MVEPEDYEFVEPIIDKKPLQPIFDIDYDNEWERELYINSALVPLYLGKNLDSSGSNSFNSEELVNYIATFYERSRVYHSFLNDWLDWASEDQNKPYTTKRAGVHIFAPIYAQELEGPMRYHAAVLNDLLDEFSGSDGDWRNRLYDGGERQYFGNVLNTCIQSSQSIHGISEYEELNRGLDFLTKALILIDQHSSYATQNGLGKSFEESLNDSDFDETPMASDIRNGFAHANYNLNFDDALNINEKNIDVEIDGTKLTKRVESIISYISRHMSLIFAIITGVTLALYHISIKEDYDDQIEILWNVLPGQVSMSGY